MVRFLSGIQPSGRPHLGNYFGAIREHVALQGAGEGVYFIANYHALTTAQDAERLRQDTFEVPATYLACQAEVVPVGQDQVQPVEMARDMAEAFHEAFFAPYRERRKELDVAHVEAVLAEGARRAREIAGRTLGEARRACGID